MKDALRVFWFSRVEIIIPVYGTAIRMQATILAKSIVVDSVVKLIGIDIVGVFQDGELIDIMRTDSGAASGVWISS